MPRHARILEPAANTPPPVVLIASGHEWSARALRSVLTQHGYDVRIAHNARQLATRAHEAQPDVVIIEDNLPDVPALEACRAVRSDPEVSLNTPILITGAPSWAHEARFEALAAGAWDVVPVPINAEELILRLQGYAAAKIEADRARDDSLIDPVTGFYNLGGFLRRLNESTAEASRFGRPLGCIVFQLSHGEGDRIIEGDRTWNAFNALAEAIRSTVRNADVAGRVDRTKLAVIAPETEVEGSLRLAQRVLSAAARDIAFPFVVRAGYSVETSFSESAQPEDILARATTALRRAETDGTEIKFFEFDAAIPAAQDPPLTP